jgi:hypothetical protein
MEWYVMFLFFLPISLVLFLLILGTHAAVHRPNQAAG